MKDMKSKMLNTLLTYAKQIYKKSLTFHSL